MGRLSRLTRTVSHLRLRQIIYQLRRRLLPAGNVPAVPARVVTRAAVRFAEPLRRSCAGAENTFTFLNSSRTFDLAPMDWAPAEMSKLWRYNLHYFDYLLDDGRSWANKAFLMDDWISRNPQGTVDAWEPFPVSLRIVNWIKLFLSPDAAEKVSEVWRRSLYEQALWLEQNIEYHLLANHLFKNGKALFFAGVFFSGPDAQRWLKKGLRILVSQLDEQILSDGGHFERSPMYHAMLLEDCLDLVNLLQGAGETIAGCGEQGARLLQKLRTVCPRMIAFLMGMSHPDGRIALFNDAALGIEPEPSQLAAYYGRLTNDPASEPSGRSWFFPDTGYYVMAPQTGDRLIIDCGPVGPDYQPGHAHCDTLSFELSLQGRRVVVDSGCSQYIAGEIRGYNRGNEGHNTLTVDGENQSEVWGAHRCGRRAYPLGPQLVEQADGSLRFMGAHDGYQWLPGKPVHRRMVHWNPLELRIEDAVTGTGHHQIALRLHLHPDLRVCLADNEATIFAGAELVARIAPLGEGLLQQTEGWYCPEFGVQLPCPVLAVSHVPMPLPFTGGWRIRRGE